MATRRGPSGLVKAASRHVTPAAAPDSASYDRAVLTFIEAVGGRQALTDTLAVAATATELQPIAQLLLDSRYDGQPVTRLCRLAGLTVADLLVAYRKALVAKAHIKAAVSIAERIPAVVDDVLRRAAPHDLPCDACQGLGETRPRATKADPLPIPVPCSRCRGSGQTHHLPDLDRQKLALELAQLSQKSGGIFVQQNNVANDAPSAGLAAGPGALESLQQAVSQILYNQPITLAPDGAAEDAAPTVERLPRLHVVDADPGAHPITEPGEPPAPIDEPIEEESGDAEEDAEEEEDEEEDDDGEDSDDAEEEPPPAG